jgi:hypothetical protein
VERVRQDEVAQRPRVLEGVGLGDDAAIGVPVDCDPAKAEGDPQALHLVDISREAILAKVSCPVRAPTAVGVKVDYPERVGEALKPGIEIAVRRSGSAGDKEEGWAMATAPIPQAMTVRGDERSGWLGRLLSRHRVGTGSEEDNEGAQLGSIHG